MSRPRAKSAPKLSFQGQTPVVCCSCSSKNTSPLHTFCTLHQSWLQLQQSLIDKEHEVHSLDDKVSNLEIYRTECCRKDEIITSLRQENAQLQKCVTEKNLRTVQLCEELESLKRTVADKDAEISQLSDNHLEINSKLRSTSRHRESLQSQLAFKTDLLSGHSMELKELKKEKQLIEDQKALADDSNKEKQITISSLQERIKQLKSSNQELQSKLENVQNESSQLRENERALRLDLNQQKTKFNQVKLQLDNTLKQLSELQTINLDLANRLGQTQDNFNNLCHQLRTLTGLHTSAKNDDPSESIITAVSSLVKEQLRIKHELTLKCQELQKVATNFTALQQDAKQLSRCLASMKKGQFVTACNNLKHTAVEEEMQPLKTSLLNSLLSMEEAEHKLNFIATIALSSLALCGDDTTCTEKEDVEKNIQFLSDKLKEYHQQIQTLEERMKIQVSAHDQTLQLTLASIKQEYEARTREAVELAQTEERNIRKQELDDIKASMIADKEALESNYSAVMEVKTNELQSISLQLKAKEERVNELEASLKESLAHNSTFSVDVVKLEEKIAFLEVEQKEEEAVLRATLETKEKEYEETIHSYKIQNQEHAKTIVSMESKLLAEMDKQDEMKKVHQELEDRIKQLKMQLDEAQKETSEEATKLKPLAKTPSAKSYRRNSGRTEKLALKRQLTLANTSLQTERKTIEELQQKVASNEEVFKRELDNTIASHQAEVHDLKTSLAEKEQMVAHLTNDVTNKTAENARLEDELKQRVEEQNKLLAAASTADAKTEETSSFSVLSIGQRCIGENHEQVIKSQGYALNEMRKKISELITTNPPVPSHQAALKELSKLRQEIAHMRAEEVIRNEAERRNEQERQKQVLAEVKEAKVSDHELADVKETLKESEEAYSQLLGHVCDYLSIAQPPPFQSLYGKNKVARSIILKDREIFVDNRLKESVLLLKKCYKRPIIEEEDVQEAKPTEEEPDKQATLAIAQPDLTHLGVYSSEAMEDLDKEKRLLNAITKRQEFKQNQSDKKIKRRHSHSCLVTQEEVDHKVGEVRKTFSNRLHKKDVEIAQLKSKLNSIQLQNTALSSKMKVIRSKTV